jgi:hypothetical protein
MRRAAGILTAVLVAGLAIAGAVSAQGTPPTLTMTANGSSLTVTPAGPLSPGPTRIEFVRGSGSPSLSLAALRPGVTVEQFTAALRRSDNDALELIYLDAGADLDETATQSASTVSLRAGLTYVAVNTEGDSRAAYEVVPIGTVGTTPNGAATPSADATINAVDLRFTGSGTLPRDGSIRFRNRGWAPHFAISAPVRRGVTSASLGRALRSTNDQALGRVLDFRRVGSVQSLVTRGADVVSEVRFPRAGRYALICFFEGHAQQGMYRIVRVR